jgi:tetratricopeptide (TPR) repeat protein
MVGAVLAALAIALVAASALAQNPLKEGTESWYLERGKKNMEIGNYKAAIEAYEKATKLDPNNREAMKQLGIAYEKQGLITDAIKQYDLYLGRFHDDADIAFKQADYLGWSRYAYRREDAIRYYRMGLEVRQDDERRHKLAQLLSRDKKQVNEALDQYRTLLKSKPNNAAWRAEYRKLLLWDDKNLKEAIEEYRRYSQEKKGDYETDHTLAQLLARANPKGDETLKLYADLVKRKPDDTELRREYADLLSGTSSETAKAIEQYRKLAASDPRPETRHQLAKLLAQDKSHLDEALREYQKVLEARPDNAEWRAEYRKLLLWDPRHLDESIREQRKVVAESKGDLDATHTLAQLIARQDPGSAEARKLYADLAKRKPGDTAIQLEYADLLAADPANRSQAISEYRAILEHDRNPETRHKLARLLGEDRANLDEAVAEYRKLIDTDPGNAVWNAEYRELLLWDDKYLGSAVDEYRRFADQRQGDPETQHTYARLLARQDPRSQEAIARYDQLVKRNPDDVALRREYANLLAADKSHHADAIREYKVVVERDPDPETRHRLAGLLSEDRANADEALVQYRQLLKDEPNNEQYRIEYRKLLLWDDRNTKEAIVEYRRFAAEKPGDFEVHHTLAKLLARDDPRSDEAISLYRSLAKARPDDPELRVEYAQLLAADPKRRNEAIEQYRVLVKEEPTIERRELLADMLSGRPEGRAEAEQQYAALLQENPDNIGVRLKYAGMLAGRREDTQKAIEQYERVLRKEPKNAAAHAGLAQGYAALRKQDQAVREANLAVKYGAKGDQLVKLRKDLMRTRDPRLQLFANGFVQRGTKKSRLDGLIGGAGARADAGSVLTLRVQGGGEEFWGNKRDFTGGIANGFQNDSAGAGFVRGDVDLHLGAENDLGVGAGYHGLGERGYIGRAEFIHLGESWRVSLGAERSLRYDSFVALAGDTINGQDIGSARENRAHLQLRYQGEKGTFSIEPYGGFVDANKVSKNPFGGARIDTRYRIFSGDHVDVSPMLGLEAYGYRFDAFSIDLEPGHTEPGGYFSPEFFASGEPGLAINTRLGDNVFFDLEGGPAFQVVKAEAGDWETKGGGQGRAELVVFLHPSIYWAIGTEVKSIGSAYTRIGAATRLAFEF